jgi:tRNA(Ile)-lysidine synthase
MLQSFLTYINDRSLFESHHKILLAVSGGRDSMLMLDLFFRAGFNFAVAHCNFQLRPSDSDGDEAFVRQYCEEKRIPFFAKRFETKKEAEAKGVSTQMMARDLRYAWFEELRQHLSCDYIATAHHLNDAVETLFLNITKGTGPKGLRSIPAKQGHIIRPLMFAGSEELAHYVAFNHIQWREDVSNQTLDYQRNKIRHEVIPVLREINPSLEETVARNISRFQDLAGIFEERLAVFEAEVVSRRGDGMEIDKMRSKAFTGYALLLEEFLKPYGFNYAQVNDILHAAPGKIFQSAGYVLESGRALWLLSPVKDQLQEEIVISEDDLEVSFVHGKLLLEQITHPPLAGELKEKGKAFLDLNKLAFPLVLRVWKNGDVFRPFGMKGNKKVSDYLVDQKVDSFDKNKQYVLCDQSGIVWLVGQRIDDRCRISENTSSVLKVEWQ